MKKRFFLLTAGILLLSCGHDYPKNCGNYPCKPEPFIDKTKTLKEITPIITPQKTLPEEKRTEKGEILEEKTILPELLVEPFTTLLKQENLADSWQKVAEEHNLILKEGQFPLADTHSDRALHGNIDGPLAKYFNKFIHTIFPNWGPFVTEEELRERGSGIQVMSIPTDGFPPLYFFSQKLYTRLISGNSEISSVTRLNRVVEQTAFSYRWVEKNPDKLTISWSYQDVISAISNNRTVLVPAIEGAQFLVPEKGYKAYGDYEKKLREFIADPQSGIPKSYPLPTSEEVKSISGLLKWCKKLGVLYISLNHLGGNRFSGSDLGPGNGKGISKEGLEVIKMMQEQGILLDLAHASQASQKQIPGLKLELPLIVSHGVIAIAGEKPDWRDTRPEILSEIKRTGGIFGVMFATQYLPKNALDYIIKEIKFLREQIGIEHIAIGTDSDGFVNLAIKDLKGLNQVFAVLRQEGFTEAEIARISFGNYLNVLKKRDKILSEKNPK